MDKKLRYLSTRRDLMRYPTFQTAGWPIGSGMVESANKLVMQMRRHPGRGCAGNPLMSILCSLCARPSVMNVGTKLGWQFTRSMHVNACSDIRLVPLLA